MSEPRSWLFVPADSEKKITKALDSDADAIIFDLEDSVAPALKPVARDLLKTLPKRSGGPNGGCASTRSAANITRTTCDTASASPTSTGSSCPRPKAAPTSPSSPTAPATSRSTRSSPRPPASLFGLLSYRQPGSPLAAMSWGAEDLSAALGASSKYDANGELSFTYKLARSLCLAGAVAAGVQPVDGVFADFSDEEGLQGRSRGRAPRRLHRQARHPSRAGAGHQRRLHAVRRRGAPRRSDRRRVRGTSRRGRAVGRRQDGRSAASRAGAGAFSNERRES